MFRILIVDDERIVLNGIHMMIEDNLELGFPVDIVTASNVPQAMELLKSFEPDLILTDIRMPVMDGFELIRYARKRNYSGSIVILTSHADFGYAQQAIRFNVMDFILKPIDQEILKATIEKVYEQKCQRNRATLHSTLMELRNMMLYDLPPQELLCDPAGINQLFPHTYFTAIVLSLLQIQEGYGEILQKILLAYFPVCRCFLLQERGQIIAICNHDQFHVKIVNLKQEFMYHTGCEEVWAGISISASSYKVLHSLYTNALQQVFYMKHIGEDRTLTEISLFTFQDCVSIFRETEEGKTLLLLQDYFTKIKAAAENADVCSVIYRSFCHNIRLYLENNHIHLPEESWDTEVQIRDYQELTTWIMVQLKNIRRSIQKNNDHNENDTLIKQLLYYIEQHYREDVSLDDLADHVGMHPNYVCTVFKKSVGQSYLVCLHRERLSTAKKLLVQTDMTMERIAEEVGYNSASQLARVFRKYEGMSPSAFRSLKEKTPEGLAFRED